MLSFLLSPYLKLSNVCNMMLLQQMGYRTNEGKERKSESTGRQWKPPLSRGNVPHKSQEGINRLHIPRGDGKPAQKSTSEFKCQSK